jgi:hypothetical protein
VLLLAGVRGVDRRQECDAIAVSARSIDGNSLPGRQVSDPRSAPRRHEGVARDGITRLPRSDRPIGRTDHVRCVTRPEPCAIRRDLPPAAWPDAGCETLGRTLQSHRPPSTRTRTAPIRRERWNSVAAALEKPFLCPSRGRLLRSGTRSTVVRLRQKLEAGAAVRRERPWCSNVWLRVNAAKARPIRASPGDAVTSGREDHIVAVRAMPAEHIDRRRRSGGS